ncbi:MAG: ATP-dependent Clp protease adaptor ClpS [Polyangiales bacterium]
MARRPKEDGDSGTIVETRQEKKLAKPRMYKVLLHNDHYTTREFVVAILIEIFRKSETDAVQIMMHVHQRGIGVAGVYTFEVAQTKIHQVEELARENEFPLLLTMEPEDD